MGGVRCVLCLGRCDMYKNYLHGRRRSQAVSTSMSWNVHEHAMNTHQPVNSSGFSQWISTIVECARLLLFVILACNCCSKILLLRSERNLVVFMAKHF